VEDHPDVCIIRISQTFSTTEKLTYLPFRSIFLNPKFLLYQRESSNYVLIFCLRTNRRSSCRFSPPISERSPFCFQSFTNYPKEIPNGL
jgi:hypothetical protein